MLSEAVRRSRNIRAQANIENSLRLILRLTLRMTGKHRKRLAPLCKGRCQRKLTEGLLLCFLPTAFYNPCRNSCIIYNRLSKVVIPRFESITCAGGCRLGGETILFHTLGSDGCSAVSHVSHGTNRAAANYERVRIYVVSVCHDFERKR